MADTIGARLKHAWNAFVGRETELRYSPDLISTYSYGSSKPDRIRLRYSTERSIISSIYTRLSIDCAGVEIRHVRLDDNDRYLKDMETALNYCLTVATNIDQTARAFRQDIFMTLFDKGVIAIVPVDTTINPMTSGSFDVKTMRVGTVTTWYTDKVLVNVYNEKKGLREDILLPKANVAIVENPFYSVMNEPNSTLQRLISKLNMLDAVDTQSSSGKLDLLVQLPYVVKSEARKQQAQTRRHDIEVQLNESKYGIAYIDSTERVTQLNRPVENNLWTQITELTEMLYNQLGLTVDILKGTADEATMLNYFNRTIEPIIAAVVDEMHRTFVTRTGITQKQAIAYFRDPFKLVPLSQIAELADKLTRNEIATSNEIRQVIGWKPAQDPRADQLRNSNMPTKDTGIGPTTDGTQDPNGVDVPVDNTVVDTGGGEDTDQILADLEAEIDRILAANSQGSPTNG